MTLLIIVLGVSVFVAAILHLFYGWPLIITVPLVGLVAFVSVAFNPPRSEADEPPAYLYEHCISWGEFQTLTGGTMSDFEARYGLTGYGTVVRTADHGSVVIKQYRWCGQFPDAVMVQVAFVLNKAGQYKAVDAVEFDYRDPMQHHPLR